MKIYIDADGSPVKETTIEIATQYQLPVVLVTNYAHYSGKEYGDHVQMIYVDMGADTADYKIASIIAKGDILVTQDYGLAAIAIAKARVLHQSGQEFTTHNIDQLLAQRAESGKMRRSGKHSKGPKPYTEAQRQTFSHALISVIAEELAGAGSN